MHPNTTATPSIKINLVAPARCGARLADALRECGVFCEDGGGARAVVVSSLAFADATDTAAVLKTLGEDAIVAAQTPPRFPFVRALTARAEKMWHRPALAIPPLRSSADFANAAQSIAAALSRDSRNSDSDSGRDGAEFAPRISPAEAVARARRALDDVL
ncbi:MAG: hypothetical protein ACR2QC_01255 [Gammaproteobacteria bacterium]